MHKPTHMNVLLSVTLTFPDPLELWICVWKIPRTLTPALSCAGLIWYKRVTGVFIEQHRATLSPPFYTMSPFQPRHYWQPCSLTGKAIMSAHWQQIACCANRFVSPLAGARCSSLCSDTIHPFFDALLHSTKTICIKMSVFFFVFFKSNTDVSFRHCLIS